MLAGMLLGLNAIDFRYFICILPNKVLRESIYKLMHYGKTLLDSLESLRKKSQLTLLDQNNVMP